MSVAVRRRGVVASRRRVAPPTPITFVGTSPLSANNSTVNISGLGVQADDVVLLLGWDRLGSTAVTHTFSASYTVEQDKIDLGSILVSLAWKRAGAGEANPTFSSTAGTTSGYYGVAGVARGVVNTGSPFDVVGSWVTGSGLTVTYPEITTLTAGAMAIGFAIGDDDDGPLTVPLDWDERADFETATGGDTFVQIISRLFATAGATGTPVATKSATGAHGAMVLALKPS